MQLNSDTFFTVVNFETYDGVLHRNLKFLSILDPGTLLQLGQDLPAKHAQYYPFLPDGTPNSFQGYQYAKFVDAEGNSEYYGLPWIKQPTIVEVTNPAYNVLIRNPTQAQLDALRGMMTAAGITDYEITLA